MIMFEQLATTNISLERKDKMSQATVIYRTPSRKIIQNVECYYINEDGNLITTKIENLKENKNEILEKSNSGITFKLELEDEESKLAVN